MCFVAVGELALGFKFLEIIRDMKKIKSQKSILIKYN